MGAAWLVRRGGQWHGLSPSGRRVRGPRPPSARRRGPRGKLYGAVRRGDLDPAAVQLALRLLLAAACEPPTGRGALAPLGGELGGAHALLCGEDEAEQVVSGLVDDLAKDRRVCRHVGRRVCLEQPDAWRGGGCACVGVAQYAVDDDAVLLCTVWCCALYGTLRGVPVRSASRTVVRVQHKVEAEELV